MCLKVTTDYMITCVKDKLLYKLFLTTDSKYNKRHTSILIALLSSYKSNVNHI